MDEHIRRNVLVTAGGSGIGLGIASAFLECGDNVLVCDISATVLDELRENFPDIESFVTDVGDATSVADTIATIRKKHGDIDVLVNNAGVSGPTAVAEDIGIEEWNQTIDVNLNGMFYCIREVLPVMKARQSGSIINISSCSARVGMTNRLAYVTSKVGVLGLNYALAREVGPFNVRVNAILPGAVDGARCRRMVGEYASRHNLSEEQAEIDFLKHHSMKSWIKPSEIGDMAVFLASDKARHITGQSIGVDGLTVWEE